MEWAKIFCAGGIIQVVIGAAFFPVDLPKKGLEGAKARFLLMWRVSVSLMLTGIAIKIVF